MHSFEPPYAHNVVKPDNVLITQRKEQHLAILMDFESARPARRAIRSQAEALQLQVPLYLKMQIKIVNIIWIKAQMVKQSRVIDRKVNFSVNLGFLFLL
jgi:hypothetical protein